MSAEDKSSPQSASSQASKPSLQVNTSTSTTGSSQSSSVASPLNQEKLKELETQWEQVKH